MQVNRGAQFVLGGLAMILLLDCPLRGAEPNAKAAGTKGPVASAFTLPKGVVLNPQQQAAYDALKQAEEGELREALDEMHQAEGNDVKLKAAKVRECRARIRAGIQEIVATPFRDAGNSGERPGGGGSEASGGSGAAYGSSGALYPYQPGYYPRYPYYPYGSLRSSGYPYPYPYTGSGTGGSQGDSKGTTQPTTRPGSKAPSPPPPTKPAPNPKPNNPKPPPSRPK